jgi:hypothetical protein
VEVLATTIDLIVEVVVVTEDMTIIIILVLREGEEVTAETEIVALHTERDLVPVKGRAISFLILDDPDFAQSSL